MTLVCVYTCLSIIGPYLFAALGFVDPTAGFKAGEKVASDATGALSAEPLVVPAWVPLAILLILTGGATHFRLLNQVEFFARRITHRLIGIPNDVERLAEDIDDRRIYLMGHSQGGGGARHLAEKYPSIWAGVALLAPALFDVELSADSAILDVPLMIAIGTEDFLIDGVRSFAGQLETLNATYEYAEFDGLDHGTIIMGSMPEVFGFFAGLTKSAPK